MESQESGDSYVEMGETRPDYVIDHDDHVNDSLAIKHDALRDKYDDHGLTNSNTLNDYSCKEKMNNSCHSMDHDQNNCDMDFMDKFTESQAHADRQRHADEGKESYASGSLPSDGAHRCSQVSDEDDPIQSKEEREHFFRILQAFKFYKCYAKNVVYKRLKYIDGLPEKQRQYLSTYSNKLDSILDCIDINDILVQQIIDNVEHLFENKPPYTLDTDHGSGGSKLINSDDFEKVQVTLKQFYRDWSEEGAQERNICYKPIIDEILHRFPAESCDTEKVQVLVPGAGLGRLAFEIASRGYTCQGNEFSFYMLFASNFVLNRCKGRNSCSVYPWLHQVDNVLKDEHQLKRITFPDISLSNLSLLQEKSIFSMCAGDFLEVYKKRDEWDCVATCFFIDCANNICQFIEQIHHILKPGGVWINFGPLQYHYSSSLSEDSIEPSYDNLKHIIKSVGFDIQKEEVGIKSCYSQNYNSMLKYTYECVYFVCIKRHINGATATAHDSS